MGSNALIPILLLHFFLPAIISFLIYKVMARNGLIKSGDLKLTKEAN